MRVTATRAVQKQCPYKDEVDVGTLTIVWETDDDVPELHELAHMIDSVADAPSDDNPGYSPAMTHEQWTLAVRTLVPDAISVTSEWQTGPWGIRINALSDDTVDTTRA